MSNRIPDELLEEMFAPIEEETVKEADSCIWSFAPDGDSCDWQTECDNIFSLFVDGRPHVDGPVENGYLYCPFCGKQIVTEE